MRKKKTFTKSTWYDWHDWLINYIPELMVGVKDQIVNFLKIKDYSKLERVKTMYRRGKKQLEENILNNIRNYLKLKKENEAIIGIN